MTSETPALPPGLLRQEAPGYRGIIASGVSQKRKASHTLVPSDPSQSKKYRGLYQTEPSSESTSDPTIEHECSSQDLSEQDTPKTPVRDAFPSAGPELETTPRANRTTATEDPVGSAPLTTPTQTTTTPGPAALAASFDALSVTGGTHATPIRSSTATIDPRSGDPSDSKSRQTSGSNKRTKPRSSNTVNSNASNRHTKVNARTMDAVMKTELHGAVFLYRGFYDDFFGYGGTRPQVLEKVNSTSLEEVRKNIKSDLLKFEDPHWSFDVEPFNEGDESKVYKPLVDLFNVIGRAVYDVHFGDQSDRFRPRYRPFVDQHNTPSKGDYPSDAGTKPDLVKGERDDTGAVHWGDVELVVECKSRGQQGDQNEAYLQLARYARAIFSHQIYRLHVFGVAVCGPIVTFVRFDRSGLLHSPDIDISTSDGADLFVRNMISLLSLPAKEFGYDPRYTFQLNRNNRLDTHFALVEGQSSRVPLPVKLALKRNLLLLSRTGPNNSRTGR
ncbi:hypothetical protein FRC07_010999 [Ceratobasidium sp. 392]|nr:hypothetical protein FRC07_010999 [Ceratobasidium sp. 392]